MGGLRISPAQWGQKCAYWANPEGVNTQQWLSDNWLRQPELAEGVNKQQW